MVVIVTAFISDANSAVTTDEYIHRGKQLLSQNYNVVCFIEKHIFDKYFATDDNYPKTMFVFFEREDNYLYDYENSIDFLVSTENPDKDTLHYMFTMCHKTEWVKRAIILDRYGLIDQYMWVDFGIVKVMPDINTFHMSLSNAVSKQHHNVRIASCWDLNYVINDSDQIYKSICWYFAGGVFGGNTQCLLQFADLMKEKCLGIIREKKQLMWEVNIWYIIYLEHPELFDGYAANHDRTILSNY